MSQQAEDKRTKIACEALFQKMLRCLSDSTCVLHHPSKKTALQDCAGPAADGVDESCKAIQAAYAHCRRAQIDNRRRIRGVPSY